MTSVKNPFLSILLLVVLCAALPLSAQPLDFAFVDNSGNAVTCVQPDTFYRLQANGPTLDADEICLLPNARDYDIVSLPPGTVCRDTGHGDDNFLLETVVVPLPDNRVANLEASVRYTPVGGSATTHTASIGWCDLPPTELAAPCVDLPTDAVAWYDFDSDGGSFTDRVLGNSAIVARGTPEATPGIVIGDDVPIGIDGALHFDGDLLTASNRSELQFGLGPFTIETWIKSDDSEAAIVGKRRKLANGNFRGWVLMIHQDRLWLRTNTRNYSVPSFVDVTDGTWHHVAVVFDQTSTTSSGFYVDGQRVSTFDATLMTSALSYSSSLQIGALELSEPVLGLAELDGKLDELTLYDRALSSNEISLIAAVGAVGKRKGTACPPVAPLAQSMSCRDESTTSHPYTFLCTVSASGGIAPYDYDFEAPTVPSTVTGNRIELSAATVCASALDFPVEATVTDLAGTSVTVEYDVPCG
ncbi:MAG: LamG domain-containing protein [Acidobacteriota bacterium]